MKTFRKIKPYTRAWESEANAIARSFAPTIAPCKNCGHPYFTPYICDTCDFDNSLDPS